MEQTTKQNKIQFSKTLSQIKKKKKYILKYYLDFLNERLNLVKFCKIMFNNQQTSPVLFTHQQSRREIWDVWICGWK